MSEATASGLSVRCYCGAVSLGPTAPPVSIVNCHCGQCRRLSGAAFTTWASFQRSALPMTGDERLTSIEVTAHVTRHFCRACGSHVFTADRRLPAILGVPAGALEGGPVAAPSAHYFVDDRAAWHSICDDLPRFGGESGTEPMAR